MSTALFILLRGLTFAVWHVQAPEEKARGITIATAHGETISTLVPIACFQEIRVPSVFH